MRTICIYISLLFIGLSSCNKEETPTLSSATPEFLLTNSDYKKWEMIDPSIVLNINVKLPIIMPACKDAEVKNGLGYFYNIYTNGTIEFQDGCGKTATEKTLIKGTWAFNGDKSNITVSLNGLPVQSWTIKTLTAARLVVSVDGAEITFAPTPFKS